MKGGIGDVWVFLEGFLGVVGCWLRTGGVCG